MKQRLLARAMERDYSSSPQKRVVEKEEPQREEIKFSSSEDSAPSEDEREACDNTPLSDEKPVCFLMLENYISEVCSEIERVNCICQINLDKAPIMVKALNDCVKVIPDLSIFFYNLAMSILRDLAYLDEDSDFSAILQKLLELADFLKEKRFRSNEHPVYKYNIYCEDGQLEESLGEIRVGLARRLDNINSKLITVIGKTLKNDVALTDIAKAYILLVCEIDGSLRKYGYDPTSTMVKYANVPSKVIQATRKVFSFIENQRIPEDTIRRIEGLIFKAPIENIKEKSGVGVMLYEFLLYTAKFFDKIPQAGEKQVQLERTEILNITEESPVKKKKAKKHVFADSAKQKLFESIIIQKKVVDKFRDFLKDKLSEITLDPTSDTEKLREFANEKTNLVREFCRLYAVDQDNFERISSNKVFLECLDQAVKRIVNPSYLPYPKPVNL